MNLDLKFYASIFWRRFPYFLIVVLLVTAFGLSLAMLLPPEYRAETLMLVEDEQIPDNLARSTVQTRATEQLQILGQRVMSRANLIDLANRFGLYRDRPDMDSSAIVDDMRNRIIFSSQAKKGLALTLSVGFTGADPDQVFQVANHLATQILSRNVEMRTELANQTLEFFRQDVTRLGSELDSQGEAILQFRLANQTALPDSLDYRRNRQASLQERLAQLQRDKAAQTERRMRLVEIYERTGQVSAARGKMSPMQRQLADLQTDLRNAEQIYSTANPRVRFLKTRIAALEDAVAEEQAEGAGDGQELSLYEVQLADIDGEIEYIDEQRELVERQLEGLEASIDATPRLAAQLAEMQRKLDITRDQYNNSIRSLAAAQTGERIESLSKGQRLSVVEPAALPTSPYSPNRNLIALGSVAGGIFLGLAVVVLLEVLNRAIRHPSQIVGRLGVTPIATLPFVRTRREARLRRAILACSFFIAVFGVSGALYALHAYYMPMDLLVDRVMEKTGIAPLLQGFSQRLSG